MHRPDSENVAASKPAPVTAASSPGYYQDPAGGPGTTVGATHLNAITDELAALVEDVGGLALDRTDDGQIADVLGALRSHATDTGTDGTYRVRAALACSETSGGAGKATGDGSAAIASHSSGATGHQSVVAASAGAEAAGQESAAIACGGGGTAATVSAPQSAAIACRGSSTLTGGAGRAGLGAFACQDVDVGAGGSSGNAGGAWSSGCDVDGFQAAAIASTTTTIGANATEAAAVACEDVSIAATGTGDRHAAVACKDTVVAADGHNVAAVACKGGELASAGGQAALVACTDGAGGPVRLEGHESAALGVLGQVTGTGNRLVLVASELDATGVTIGDSNTLAGGHGASVTWKINSETGRATLALLSLTGVPSGATQGAAGASAGEVWRTASHASLPDGVLMLGL